MTDLKDTVTINAIGRPVDISDGVVRIEPEVVDAMVVYHGSQICMAYNEMTGNKKSVSVEEALIFLDKYYDRLPDDLKESIDFFGEV